MPPAAPLISLPTPELLADLLTESSLTWDRVSAWFLDDGIAILIVLFIAVIARWLLLRLIKRVVETATKRHEARLAAMPTRTGRAFADFVGVAHERHVQRTRTMGAILRSVVTFTVASVTILTIMSISGIPLGPILASAGIGGLAIGFGAQSLVKDFLSGIFMILEDQYGVGDVIDTGEVVGTVEDVTLRVTRLRDPSGVTWYVRNGEILRIGNKSQGWSTAIVDIPVAYDEDIERASRIIREVVAKMADDAPWDEKLIDEPTVAGVESIGAGTITIRILAKCLAQEHFGVQREMRERIKTALDREGVRSPAVPMMPPFGGGAV